MAKVLIIDDSRTSRKILRNILEDLKYEVIGEAVNGVEGVEKFKELKPDLVTLDITMPVMDGISALKSIKSIDPNSKVVMITAAGQKEMILEAVKYKADEFIVKPFDVDAISTLMKKMF